VANPRTQQRGEFERIESGTGCGGARHKIFPRNPPAANHAEIKA